jgi:hypothetical protein
MLHTGIRAYAYNCSYNSLTWLDDPTSLITILQTNLTGITYNRLLVSNVRNALRKELEIEIDGITYNTKTKLNVTENDDLITYLKSIFNNITNFTYVDVNIVNDRFLDEPTYNWPGVSKSHEGNL